jgi:hypothetical protein
MLSGKYDILRMAAVSERRTLIADDYGAGIVLVMSTVRVTAARAEQERTQRWR